MVPGWILSLVTLALLASQTTVVQPRALLLEDETSIAALEHPPLPAARAKHRDAGTDARRLSPIHALISPTIALERDDARIADVSTTFTTTTPRARSAHRTRSRAPPAAA